MNSEMRVLDATRESGQTLLWKDKRTHRWHIRTGGNRWDMTSQQAVDILWMLYRQGLLQKTRIKSSLFSHKTLTSYQLTEQGAQVLAQAYISTSPAR